MSRLAFIVTLCIAAASVAYAHPAKIALTIASDSTGLRDAVSGALDDSEVEIVSAKRTTKALDRLELDDIVSARDAGRLASELDIETVVVGSTDPRGRKLRLTIFTNGKKRGGVNVKVDADSTVFRNAVRTAILRKLNLKKHTSDDDADDDTSTRSKRKTKPELADDDPGSKHKAKSDSDDGESKTKHAKSDDTSRGKKRDDDPRDGKPKGTKFEIVEDDDGHAAKHKRSESADDDGSKVKHKAKSEVVDDDAEAKAKSKHKAKSEVSNDDDEANAKHKSDVAAGDGEAGDETTEDAEVPRPEGLVKRSPDRGANLTMMRVDLGMSLTGRSLQFSTSSAFEGAPRSYGNAPVAGGRVEAEVYPLAGNGFVGGLGIGGELDQTAMLTLRASDEMAVPLKTTERHYSIGARYRIAFGPTKPTVTLAASYGARSFEIDRSRLMSSGSLDLPDVDYKMIEPGLAVRLPLGQMVAITVGARALIVSSPGPIADAAQYGKASTYGGSATAGFEVMLGTRIAVRVAAEATVFVMKFAGTGTLATSRDGDSSTVDVLGATDRYYGGTATLAVMY